MFRKLKGRTKTLLFPVLESTEILAGGLLMFSQSATAAFVTKIYPLMTSSPSVVGVLSNKDIRSTDSDFATARFVAVEVPTERWVEWEADVTSGLTATDLGKYVDLTDYQTINRAASVSDIALVTGVINSTKARVVLTKCADFNN